MILRIYRDFDLWAVWNVSVTPFTIENDEGALGLDNDNAARSDAGSNALATRYISSTLLIRKHLSTRGCAWGSYLRNTHLVGRS